MVSIRNVTLGWNELKKIEALVCISSLFFHFAEELKRDIASYLLFPCKTCEIRYINGTFLPAPLSAIQIHVIWA